MNESQTAEDGTVQHWYGVYNPDKGDFVETGIGEKDSVVTGVAIDWPGHAIYWGKVRRGLDTIGVKTGNLIPWSGS